MGNDARYSAVLCAAVCTALLLMLVIYFLARSPPGESGMSEPLSDAGGFAFIDSRREPRE